MAKKDDFFQMGASETVIGHSVKLKGSLKSKEDIIVDGEVSGDITTESTLKVGHGAIVNANLKGKNIIISGNVSGNLEAGDMVQITETGKVVGDIKASNLSIFSGAFFSGKSEMIHAKEPEFKTVTEVKPKEVEIKPFFE
ncbi:TPA: cell shape determination protein CcmA [candidate division CPR2 bacterium]|uniref:Integral membrane protein CcmA involved in cell shape determination n=1 Tax=candidate division CPR2 bacterium GW2011_GWC1_41_48 TaxID=1618344 RepID=A0A0G0Z888_UNCC2|nr:MAG: hypothetical protein UT47_C0002G0288 [candidate division CPR2 bacterium GW2011_GWC2_39_35]KKR28436.1 MAG: hypothetical protein UT60_C0020G0006 [candidate division CPR2 bacterium GW2011_GWD2_39_7]KKS09238.1 MAG: hypothetical protein UU65_C0002G0016 [candidate division CPR2 bacterium GW2011_GWC1_41_48]OGB72665.1 MAG: hypothetical protein A2Y26_02185 [candidate division CPR2 bacterium GWD2_39_7]HBG81993.1 cell shape determination protein CcmA [candidate division CPR2 bacterium]